MKLKRSQDALIPEKTILLLSGLPATGKSSFGRHLARDHDFMHFDMEHFPDGWPDQELKPCWDQSPQSFYSELERRYNRVVLDWGFPAHCVHLVRSLREAGTTIVWFEAEIAQARKFFVARGGLSEDVFDKQVQSLEDAGLPGDLPSVRVSTLSNLGIFLTEDEIIKRIFR